jgi:undecaprenyl-diphosphatase
VLAIACLPPAIVGAALGGPIERRLGTPATVAAGLAAGGAAMALAERRGRSGRVRADAGVGDAVALGVAQTLALIPGVSRSGATRAAARWRGFGRLEADALSAEVGLPITLGALALKGRETLVDGERAELAPLATGALAAFASTLVTASASRRLGGARSLSPYAAYRVALAAAVVRRLRQNGRR